MSKPVFLEITPDFKPGDPPPQGYMGWHRWAEVQIKAGLQQTQCPTCGKWRFPQENCCKEEEHSA